MLAALAGMVGWGAGGGGAGGGSCRDRACPSPSKCFFVTFLMKENRFQLTDRTTKFQQTTWCLWLILAEVRHCWLSPAFASVCAQVRFTSWVGQMGHPCSAWISVLFEDELQDECGRPRFQHARKLHVSMTHFGTRLDARGTCILSPSSCGGTIRSRNFCWKPVMTRARLSFTICVGRERPRECEGTEIEEATAGWINQGRGKDRMNWFNHVMYIYISIILYIYFFYFFIYIHDDAGAGL